MVPVWILIPVLVVGVLVGAGLGWWMRQRSLAAAAPGVAEPMTPTPSRAAPTATQDVREPAEAAEPAAAAAPEPGAAEVPLAVDSPPSAAAVVDPPRARPEPVLIDLPHFETAETTVPPEPAPPERRPQRSTSTSTGRSAAHPADTPVEAGQHEDEPLGARMENVLSELERRYQGRRAAGPAETSETTPGEPSSRARPRRPRRRS